MSAGVIPAVLSRPGIRRVSTGQSSEILFNYMQCFVHCCNVVDLIFDLH
jgi:hypothetical protein